jgi:hypothetical protein
VKNSQRANDAPILNPCSDADQETLFRLADATGCDWRSVKRRVKRQQKGAPGPFCDHFVYGPRRNEGAENTLNNRFVDSVDSVYAPGRWQRPIPFSCTALPTFPVDAISEPCAPAEAGG